ncbi:MAG: type III-B CRISPR module RAMP protein Cmr1, partial [Myxococcales bacterium]|nr:type III-B CRISPR module RAMP protein Cmr1 [Myxococcales bacterium]
MRVVVGTTTPIFGGGVEARTLDVEDVIRVPTIRGHLRWWWRALFGDRYGPQELYEAEVRRWGGIVGDEVRRSAVTVTVSVRPSRPERRERHRGDPNIDYVTWPSKMPDRVPLRDPGVVFDLGLDVQEHGTIGMDRDALTDEIRDSVVAWILFGGYGGRTRRGMGGLTVVESPAEWLPSSATPDRIRACFRRARPLTDSAVTKGSLQVPRLAGATLYTNHRTGPDAIAAWSNAVAWLREFRQGVELGARQPGRAPEEGRPSVSNWPEADKVRHLSRRRDLKPHRPRHDDQPSWPRAAFGLPIGGRFQCQGRRDRERGGEGERYVEPDDYWISWEDETGLRDRLASPLILKALPLANGTFAPIALWLARSSPPKGQVVMCLGSRERVCPGSHTTFDAPLVAPGDACLLPILEQHSTMREAFLGWLSEH